MINSLENVLLKYQSTFGRVVDFNAATDKLFHFDFTAANKELTDDLTTDTQKFSAYVNNKLQSNNCKYGIGGYNEDRILYKHSNHFKVSESSKVSPLGGDLEGA